MKVLKQERLFDFNRSGAMIDNEAIVETKKAREFVKKLQDNKSMAQNWKLDIFLNNTVLAVCIGKAPKDSASYKEGVFEHSVGVAVLRHEGHLTLEKKDYNPLAYFPTREKALKSAPLIASFIKYRYDFDLKIDEEFKKRGMNESS